MTPEEDQATWAEAERLYSQGSTPCPAWADLQHLGATQLHWLDAAHRKLQGVEDWWSIRHNR